jgi:hypothetical protein
MVAGPIEDNGLLGSRCHETRGRHTEGREVKIRHHVVVGKSEDVRAPVNTANKIDGPSNLGPLLVRAQLGEIAMADTVRLNVVAKLGNGAPLIEGSEVAAPEQLYMVQPVASPDQPRDDKEARRTRVQESRRFSGTVDETIIEPEGDKSSHCRLRPC